MVRPHESIEFSLRFLENIRIFEEAEDAGGDCGDGLFASHQNSEGEHVLVGLTVSDPATKSVAAAFFVTTSCSGSY